MNPADDRPGRTAATHAVTALLLGLAHRAGRPSRPPPTTAVGTRATAVVAAFAAPVAAAGVAVRNPRARWAPPPSAAGRALLVGYLLSGVLVEELLWRAPLLYLRPRPVRWCGAAVSIAAFTAVHLRRDGLATAGLHLSNTVGWTVAGLLEGRIGTAVLAHTVYNVLALSVQVDDPDAGDSS